MTQPSDPVCPACGEAVGSTSTYCMHCDASFDAPVDRSTWAANASADAMANAPPADTTSVAVGNDAPDDPHMSDTSATPTSVSDYGTTSEPRDDYGITGRADAGTNDSLVDVAWRLGGLTLYVVVGLLSTAILTLATLRWGPLWIVVGLGGLLAVGIGGFVLYRRTVPSDALGDALYVTATALVAVPALFFLLVDPSQPLDERTTGAVVFGLIGGVFAVPAVLLGWWLQPDDD